MIIDFREGVAPSEYRTGVCIIGSGPIGLTIASELLKSSSIDLMVVESGALKSEPEYELLNRVVNTGDKESGLTGSRARVFGGTSTLWGGQAIPLSPLDFEQRRWVPNSGWPINFADLADYFEHAADILEIDGTDFDQDIWKKGSKFKDNIDQDKVRLTFSRWSPSPNFSKKFLNFVSKRSRVRALVNASVTELVSDTEGSAVDSAVIKSLAGREGRIQANVFILCCGGIENARILLCSKSRYPDGLGNEYHNVGKYFQDHAAFYGARLIPKNFKRFVDFFSSYFNGSQMYLPKLQTSEIMQRETRSLNVIGNVGVEYTKASTVALKHLFNDLKTYSIDRKTISHAIEVTKDPLDSLRLLLSYGIKRRMYYPKHADYFLIANCETEPDPDSRITLGIEKDALGMRIAQVKWVLSDNVKRSLLRYMEDVCLELNRLDIAECIINPSLYLDGDEWKNSVFSIYHHIGSTRMSDYPEAGVVDRDCKVHGLKNLYVAGSSVFPTSGAANPTFTAIALALRLSEKLRLEYYGVN